MSNTDKLLLEEFKKRRAQLQVFADENDLSISLCPSCGFPTLSKRWFYEICSICDWQHDGQDDKDADEIMGGPNGGLSLTQSRLNFCKLLLLYQNKYKSTGVKAPAAIYKVIQNHLKQMEAFEKQLYKVKANDPKWESYAKAKEDVLIDLLKK